MPTPGLAIRITAGLPSATATAISPTEAKQVTMLNTSRPRNLRCMRVSSRKWVVDVSKLDKRGPRSRELCHGYGGARLLQTVICVPSNFVSFQPSNGSTNVRRSSRRMPMAISSPTTRPAAESLRQ